MKEKPIDSHRRRLRLQHERDDRESEIAKCECGAQVRKDSEGRWIHSGDCSFEEGVDKNLYFDLDQ